MIGTIVNTLTILAGTTIGGLARKGIKDQYSNALFTAMGLSVVLLGANTTIKSMAKSEYPVLFIVCMAVGGLVGTMLNLDMRFKSLVSHVSGSELAKGLSTAILLFCVGTLSMVGPIMSALYGDNTYLFTNAMLDLVTSAVFASTYGFGIAWAAPVLFCSQGSIYLIALYSRSFLSEAMMAEISVVGGILIVASGFSILGIKDCKVLNLFPALLLPVLFFLIKNWLGF